MYPAKQHYIIYDRLGNDVAILTCLHQRRKIEQIVSGMKSQFIAEIKDLKKRKPWS